MKIATQLRWLMAIACFVPSFLFSQQALKFKLQLMPDGQSWGVYLKPDDSINPSLNTMTVSAQAVVVTPLYYDISNLQSIAGSWVISDVVDGTQYDPDNTFTAIGLVADNPRITIQKGVETLLFTFQGDNGCIQGIRLIEPTDFDPNGFLDANARNEIGVFDLATGGVYDFSSTYATASADCLDNDGDGLLNAHEDTNGNGFYDAGIDASNLFYPNNLPEQGIKYKLQLMPDGQRWGVYVRPDADLADMGICLVASAQVTLVAPMAFVPEEVTGVNGMWEANSFVAGPSENPNKTYFSFGYLGGPSLELVPGEELLIFTFKGNSDCPSDLQLIDNLTDPFIPYNGEPNSVGNNPGNDFLIFTTTLGSLNYNGNYAPFAWDCNDNDGDGVLNAHEDVNGNGVFDPGIEPSDLNSPDNVAAGDGLQYKLQLMPDGQSWGVYVRPEAGLNPSIGTITGSAQATVVMPKGYAWSGLKNVSGTWQADAVYNGPLENPSKTYVSFGMVTEFPHIDLIAGQETLLFTFKGDGGCPDEIRLINNETDVFIAPNSQGSNPGNEITVFDPQGGLYEYSGNYGLSAWDCHDNDGDGIQNALEDTNGNGVFDENEDASDLGQPDGVVVKEGIQFKLQLLPDGESWGVFAKPKEGINISPNTLTGTGQVVMVLPKDMVLTDFTSVSGLWGSPNKMIGPDFAPNSLFLSYGFLADAPKIVYRPGQETLLFTFKSQGGCPDDMHLISDADNVPTDLPYNLTNDISVFDPVSANGFNFLNFGGIFGGEMAWDCHDNDEDGTPNALEDTNGNGVFDPGVDASDLNSMPATGCIKLKLQILPDLSGWAVVAKRFNASNATVANATWESGRVTLVTPTNFELGNLEAPYNAWAATTVLADMPNNPNRKYITFELTAPGTPVSMNYGAETVLFTFPRLGDCPDSLYLLEAPSATGPLPNEISGQISLANAQPQTFDYCGVYNRKAWHCKKNPRLPVFNTPLDSLGTPPIGGTNRAGDFDEASTGAAAQWFTASPNPAGDFVNVAIAESQIAEGNLSLLLYDLQGKKRLEVRMDKGTAQLDLVALQPGVYFLSLSQNGRVLHREKLIKH
ncbi:MAG: T9SS type A sorting domain-containing protein [Saprospiraceae bacterium]|nr:T9SS type A sorting domain-containing protein [Saprospiraceae bacterium]